MASATRTLVFRTVQEMLLAVEPPLQPPNLLLSLGVKGTSPAELQ